MLFKHKTGPNEGDHAFHQTKLTIDSKMASKRIEVEDEHPKFKDVRGAAPSAAFPCLGPLIDAS